MSEDAAICVKGGGGLLLPLFGDWEHEWPRVLRIILYLLGLFWCFMGVAIIADVFMAAIEKVTTKKIRCFNKSTQRWYTYEVWNATVANLTLMALGSSAPEILLNVIDIFAKDFYLEGLGPSTIVGSAAFNLHMIIAVCIIAIEGGEVRYIKEIPVYAVTSSWSVMAYVWLIIILLVTSPNVVEVWEGVLTFMFFPFLTFLAWLADKGYLGGQTVDKQGGFKLSEDMSPEELVEAQAKVRKEHGEGLTDDQVLRFLQATSVKPRSRAAYRVAASRAMTGGKRVNTQKTSSLSRNLSFLGIGRKVVPVIEEDIKPTILFQFAADKHAVLESAGQVVLKVVRSGVDTSVRAMVNYTTREGTAGPGKDYEHVEGTLTFEAGEIEKTIAVSVVDDSSYEEDEEFYVDLSAPIVHEDSSKKACLGDKASATVIIIDDDDPGIIGFTQEEMNIVGRPDAFELEIPVDRRAGSCGEVKVQWRTEGDSAVAGRDFEEKSGELIMADQQIKASISINILGVARYDQVDRLFVIMTDPEGGVRLDEKMDGGSDKNILTVSIQADQKAKETADKLKSMLSTKWDKSKIGHVNWLAQFKEALLVNGGDTDDDDEPPGIQDKVLHVIAIPWKLLFAIVPPTDYCGGWLCFYCALLMIGFVTMIIGDMASLLGCTMCLPDDITAITLVALGTSLPDTFASKTAALQDPYADASVGNVTGSNSVNVFLGLGLPWMIAAIAWTMRDNDAKWDSRYQTLENLDFLGPAGSRKVGFVVPAGSLAFSVTVFSLTAIACIGTLALRRKLYGGELGGPEVPKYLSASFLVMLWCTYIALSSWKSLDELGGAKCAE